LTVTPLRRTETIAASKNVQDSTLSVEVLRSDWLLRISAFGTGTDPLGRGAQRPIRLHLTLQSKDVFFASGQSKTWAIELFVTQSRSNQ
jgi:hypothetical protein